MTVFQGCQANVRLQRRVQEGMFTSKARCTTKGFVGAAIFSQMWCGLLLALSLARWCAHSGDVIIAEAATGSGYALSWCLRRGSLEKVLRYFLISEFKG